MTYPGARNFLLFTLIIYPAGNSLFAATPPPSGEAAVDGVWQWSLPAPSIPDRRAFLWIPEDCTRVRGLVVACHNMLEKPLFQRAAFRAAAAENGLGILMIFSGHDRIGSDDKNPDHPKRSALDIFLDPNFPKGPEDPKGAGADLQKLLDQFAVLSGYSELRFVPLMPVGHSSAGSFVWHLYRWDPSRIFAMMPFKTGAKDDGPEGIPVFEVNSEWFDYGNGSHRCWSPNGPSDGIVKARNHGKCLYGYYVDIGSGHCNVSDDSMGIMSLFLKEVVAARIPVDAPMDGPVHLKPVTPSSGWMLEPATLGRPEGKPVSFADWKQDPAKGLWYVDKALADGVQQRMLQQLSKKPQQLNFFKEGDMPSTDGGTFSLSPRFLEDGETFRVHAAFINEIAARSDLYPGEKLGHSDTPILFRVNSGAVVQVGPDTFRIRPHAGPIVPQGNPWEPTIVAYNLGDQTYRPTERPAHINVSVINTGGADQKIEFPAIPDQLAGSASSVELSAKASSGLAVEYFVMSGPAEILADGHSLKLLPMPPRAKYPVEVKVGAFQWGRSVAPQVKSAGPEVRSFWARKTGVK